MMEICSHIITFINILCVKYTYVSEKNVLCSIKIIIINKSLSFFASFSSFFPFVRMCVYVHVCVISSKNIIYMFVALYKMDCLFSVEIDLFFFFLFFSSSFVRTNINFFYIYLFCVSL